MTDMARRQFKARLKGKQDVSYAIPALQGDGHGNVDIPTQPGYVYIRIGCCLLYTSPSPRDCS